MGKAAKRSTFVDELRSRPKGGRSQHSTFKWETNVVKSAVVDEAAPRARLGDAAGKPRPQISSPLPTNHTGAIDLTEIKQDLITQVKAQRKKA